MLANIIWSLIGNALALVASGYLVAGFNLDLSNLQAAAALVAVFTGLNVIIKPVLRFFLGPLIILTLGLFNIIITGGFLYVVDIYSQNLNISGLPALIYGTLIITAVNIIIHLIHRKKS